MSSESFNAKNLLTTKMFSCFKIIVAPAYIIMPAVFLTVKLMVSFNCKIIVKNKSRTRRNASQGSREKAEPRLHTSKFL